MRNVWFVAVPGLVAVLWALLLWTPERSPVPGAALESEPLRAEPPPRAAEAAKAQPAPEPTPAPVEPDPDPGAAPPVTKQASELPRMPPPIMMGPVSALKHRYESESAPGTPPAQQQQLTAAFKGEVADLLDSVECRRTVCKVRLAWLPKHGFSGMQLLAELRRDFDPNLGIDDAGPSSKTGAQSVDVFIDLTSSRPKVP